MANASLTNVNKYSNTYKDWTFQKGSYELVESYYDKNAIVLAIRNIILAKKGNFPETPSLGMNIEKYQFDFLDDQTIANIKNELNDQISKYIPSVSGVDISIDKIDDEMTNSSYLGISIMANTDGNNLTANFLIMKEQEEVKIYNEIF